MSDFLQAQRRFGARRPPNRREQAARASPAARPHKRDARRTGPGSRAGARANYWRRVKVGAGRNAVERRYLRRRLAQVR